jgi:hypothetical protein
MPMPRSTSLRDAIADRLAAQWIALGSQLAGPAETGVVDLEALIAATATLDRASEARVRDAGVDWCVAFGQAVSVSRLKTVAREMGVAGDPLSRFSADVAASGGPRWPFADGGRGRRSARGKVLVRDLSGPPRLVWRLRSAFGVNARADILAALIADPFGSPTIAELGRATRFTKRNVAVAVESMDLAGIVAVGRTQNRGCVTLPDASPFRAWLLSPRPGGPIDWVARWHVALATEALLDATEAAGEQVRLVEGRVSVERLAEDVARARLPRPDLARTGTAFLGAYASWVEELEHALMAS